MSEDILHRKQLETSDKNFDFTSDCTLFIIDDLCVRMANKPLQDLGMPSPNRIAAVSTCVLERSFKKDQPTKALQWHATCLKKNNGKPNRGHNLDRAL